ncbi:hypothetical protein RhiirA5_84505 [Rhizophagus irregularis]|uniref:Uncharacterized protein n=2 Tax=Rhizophagus irregularis TaxID=588596 RepID=A0A2N0Q1L1_9GLOM|nr:hypothetical protein GLOIN_2v1690309 [Rhizophagus irregularis DAOM 181602=DAOM 197198]PKC12926.1 hypothetical protein RhiirA5_84505 [Rhizophagus irregularis]POG63043.1 hypothetical protein GLOIN_2v1690309 [Rhizophagus irregularis DAOM 181602=DAOM 197198]|eukprot:XP_025169909.1 hypothetical protein GLOIN_2v1690309 [Rhizophagus irregularis DAOM 181602=DAOM 197198]
MKIPFAFFLFIKSFKIFVYFFLTSFNLAHRVAFILMLFGSLKKSFQYISFSFFSRFSL